VADQDAALRFYTEVLGFELHFDTVVAGTRMIELLPSGGGVAVVLLPPDSTVPIAVRMGTSDADAARAAVKASGVTLHNDEGLRGDGVPPMFSFTDPDGNGLVYLED